MILHDHFLPPPYSITQVNGHPTIPDPEEHDRRSYAPFLFRHCLPIHPLHAFNSKLYDLYCPSVRDDLEKRYYRAQACGPQCKLHKCAYCAKCGLLELLQDEQVSFCTQALAV